MATIYYTFELPLETPTWYNSGIALNPGATAIITAQYSGTWDGYHVAYPWGSPGWGWFPISGTPLAQSRTPFSLVVYQGSGNPGFNIPTTQTWQGGFGPFTVGDAEGSYLWFGMNDLQGAYPDNTGHWTITIQYEEEDGTNTNEEPPVEEPDTPKHSLFVCYAPVRRMRAMLNDSTEIELEWNSATNTHIDGIGKDGGAEMPEGHWESGWRRGPRRRLANVAVDPPTESGHEIVAFVEGGEAEGHTANVADRWERMPMACQGFAHKTKIVVNEESPEVRVVTLRESLLGPRLNR